MRYVGYDHIRKQPADLRGSRRTPRGLLIPALMLACVALLVLSRLEPQAIDDVRVRIAAAARPVLEAAMVPLSPVRTAGEALAAALAGRRDVERLINENQQLKGWEARAKDLERQLTELGSLAKAARDTEIQFVTTRVMATSSGPFVRSAMINAGRGERVKLGFPALAGGGLAGRVAVVGEGVSRLSLITDAESRIPVFVGPGAVSAVLAGDNGSAPGLVMTSPVGVVNVGDEVTTSGMGGLFPRGLRIGTVTRAGERLVVTPHADLDRLEYVSILFYEPGAGELPPLDERLPASGERQAVMP